MGIYKRHAAVRLLSVLLALGVLTFLVMSCKPSAPANGTITVNLINAAGHDSATFMFGVYKEGTNYITGVADGLGLAPIISGASTGTVLDTSLTDVMIFAGGGRYYVYAYVDADPPADGLPTSGTDEHGQSSVFTVDGNMTQELDFTSFTTVP
jgi:hypothetical protein